MAEAEARIDGGATNMNALYSCDDHLDLYAVHPDVWESRLTRAHATRGPHVETRDGRPMWICEDRVLGRSGAGHSKVAKSLNAIGRAGIDDDGFRAGTPKLRLEDMDRDHLQVSVVYGPLSLGFPIDDPELQRACYAAWNDWAAEEFNAFAPDRLCTLAFLPGHSPEAAATELERCAALGHRGAIIAAFDVDLGDRAWDRLWAAGEQTGLPISFHIRGGTSSSLSYQLGKWQSAAYASVLPLQLDEPLAIMIFNGALERHPGCKIVLAESGVGWLPYFLTRMDLEWESLRDKLDYAPSIAPSEIFRRQIYATFEEEPLAEQFIPMLGADVCMWASDYPHTDSTFPNSMHAVEDTLGSLSEADRRKITVTNCARLYGFAYDG
ncbi:MAG TPA: amidohydrolase family protein [Acidimicrobiia bacterium]|nr:amidohydrolase family protein [Acidimicrobiia bacterium]